MKRSHITLTALVVLVLFAGVIFMSQSAEQQQSSDTPIAVSPTPDPQGMPTPSNSMSPSPNQNSDPSQLFRSPQIDGVLEVGFTIPDSWEVRPASSQTGELGLYSYDVSTTPATGGVPADKIKIAVTFFGPNDTRDYQPPANQIQSSEQVTVAGHTATRQVVNGSLGQFVATAVSTEAGTYLISGYPADSQLIDQYDQFLETIALGGTLPIQVTQPEPEIQISSPVTISGMAPGTWFFEGGLNITLHEIDGTEIGSTNATSSESWMTTEMIPFAATLEFETEQNVGYLQINKANPSGLPENEQTLYWPVTFQ